MIDVERNHPITMPKQYVCRECGASFTTPQGLGAHKRRIDHGARTAAPAPAPPPLKPGPTAAEVITTPRLLLERGIDELNATETRLDFELQRLEKLKLELADVARQKRIFTTALESLDASNVEHAGALHPTPKTHTAGSHGGE